MKTKKQSVAILGAGNMGTAMAKIIADNGYEVRLWNYEGDLEPLDQIKNFGENKKYLPGVNLPKNIIPTYKIEDALENSKLIYFVVSSNAMENVMRLCLPFLQSGMVLVDVSKGLDPKTNQIIPQVMKKMAGKKKVAIVGLTGPAVAKQLTEGHPAVMVAASSALSAAKEVQKTLKNKTVKILLGNDIVGGEVVQSFKNVYAIGLGITQGLGLAFNTQAILFTLAMNEMALVNKKMGGKNETVYGFAGLGDFLTTSLSPEGRNRSYGECLGQGLCSIDAIKKVEQTVEGISACTSLKKFAKKLKLNLPFASVIENIIAGKKDPRIAIETLVQKIS